MKRGGSFYEAFDLEMVHFKPKNCDHEDVERDKFPLQTSSKGVLLRETPEDSLVGRQGAQIPEDFEDL